jgi:DNA repair protein RAD7
LAIKASSFKRTLKDFNGEDVDVFANPEKFDANIIHSLGLVHVNIAGSSVTDKSMEMLAVCCKSSLEELDVSSCTSISDKGLGYLVSKLGGQFSKIHVWGMAQLTEEFLDGHDRVEEGGLEICGVWMKKSGGRSVR